MFSQSHRWTQTLTVNTLCEIVLINSVTSPLSRPRCAGFCPTVWPPPAPVVREPRRRSLPDSVRPASMFRGSAQPSRPGLSPGVFLLRFINSSAGEENINIKAPKTVVTQVLFGSKQEPRVSVRRSCRLCCHHHPQKLNEQLTHLLIVTAKKCCPGFRV